MAGVRLSLWVVPVVALLVLAVPGLSKRLPHQIFNPQFCPNTISRQQVNPRLASDCKGIIVPWTLCTPCKLRPFNNKGIFEGSQRGIYDLREPQCVWAMQNYIKLNPCDTPRVNQVKLFADSLKKKKMWWWKAKFAERDLGEFMYNVCELCCDCIPIGSELDQYKERSKVQNKKGGTEAGLIHIFRGNCPVHYYYDTCRMWPNLRDIAAPGQKPDVTKDKLCEEYVNPWWFHTPTYRANWLRRRTVEIPGKRYKRFRDLLTKMTQLLNCRKEDFWKECVNMELAQGRV